MTRRKNKIRKLQLYLVIFIEICFIKQFCWFSLLVCCFYCCCCCCGCLFLPSRMIDREFQTYKHFDLRRRVAEPRRSLISLAIKLRMNRFQLVRLVDLVVDVLVSSRCCFCSYCYVSSKYVLFIYLFGETMLNRRVRSNCKPKTQTTHACALARSHASFRFIGVILPKLFY